jgi:hypothetical protein
VPQPIYGDVYTPDEDPLWNHAPVPQPFDAVAWYQCDHLGTPQELTDQQGEMAWSAQYKVWGQAIEQRSSSAQRQGLNNPIRFKASITIMRLGCITTAIGTTTLASVASCLAIQSDTLAVSTFISMRSARPSGSIQWTVQ